MPKKIMSFLFIKVAFPENYLLPAKDYRCHGDASKRNGFCNYLSLQIVLVRKLFRWEGSGQTPEVVRPFMVGDGIASRLSSVPEPHGEGLVKRFCVSYCPTYQI
jgi:hypothetical protein